MSSTSNEGLGTPAVESGFDPTPYYPSPYPARPGTPDAGAGSGGGGGGGGFLSGARDPSATDGVDGNTWYNTATTYVFGPKANGAWPASGFRLAGNKIYRVQNLPTDANGLAAGDIYIDDEGRLVQIQGA